MALAQFLGIVRRDSEVLLRCRCHNNKWDTRATCTLKFLVSIT